MDNLGEFSSCTAHLIFTLSSRCRSNANLVDLNRNFPSWTDIKQSLKGNLDLKENREKETMWVSEKKRFAISHETKK